MYKRSFLKKGHSSLNIRKFKYHTLIFILKLLIKIWVRIRFGTAKSPNIYLRANKPLNLTHICIY